MAQATVYPRYAEHRLLEALEDSPVVLINGPRQCGKTTLAQTICAPQYLGSPSRERLAARTYLFTASATYEHTGRL